MLKDGTFYQDLGPNHLDPRAKERQKNRLIKRLADLGYAVELAPLTVYLAVAAAELDGAIEPSSPFFAVMLLSEYASYWFG
jgi:hypothetical protein